MLWLIWHMWLLLLIAFAIGLAAGWRIWGASPEADGRALAAARDELDRLRRENDDLTRSLAAGRAEAARPAPAANDPDGDDLETIRGLGPKAAAALRAAGVDSFAKLAAWTDAEVAEWDERLNARGRIARDGWVKQAKALSGG
ncbi:MAG: hypothetical protein KIS81_10855 [Maricaulaceae bacterium]|nr:hypothetical protein [Maricaulaceae bacterium]